MTSYTLFSNDQSQSEEPIDVIKRALAAISELDLRRNADKPERDDAVSTILALVEQLVSENTTAIAEVVRLVELVASLRSQTSYLRDTLNVERRAKEVARNTADHNKGMAIVVRDLTRIFQDQELDFEQLDSDGNVFQVIGYPALYLKVNFANWSVEVRNTARNRKVQVYYFDPSGLIAETFTAIEALFPVELTKGNTPSRAHGEMFEDEDEALSGLPSFMLGMMPSSDCGDPDCLVHGPNGMLQNGGGVSGLLGMIKEKLAASGYDVDVDSSPFGYGGFPRNY